MRRLLELSTALNSAGLTKEAKAVAGLIKQAKKYKEGPSSTFTHNKVTYSVDAAIERSKDTPVKKVAIAKLKWILKYTKPEKDRVKKADITVPILIAHYGKRLAVVDGLHRLVKAIEDGEEYLPTKLLTKADLAAIKISTNLKE